MLSSMKKSSKILHPSRQYQKINNKTRTNNRKIRKKHFAKTEVKIKETQQKVKKIIINKIRERERERFVVDLVRAIDREL